METSHSDAQRIDRPRIVRVAIASPGDLEGERDSIPGLFVRWNNNHEGVMLHPLMWELGAVPELGRHPQTILNEQIIKPADLLVAMFWCRLGSPTAEAESGTVEEIREFIERKGAARVIVYFCTRPLEKGIDDIQPAEIAALQDFKKEMQSVGLYKQFKDLGEFHSHLYSDLDAKVRQLLANELPLPGDEAGGLTEEQWYDSKHPDARLRKPRSCPGCR